MTDIMKEDEYQEIVSAAEQQTLDAVLCYSTSRNSAFFYVLSRLLTEGRIKLAKNGRFLNGTIQEQIDCFKSAYPDSEEELARMIRQNIAVEFAIGRAIQFIEEKEVLDELYEGELLESIQKAQERLK